MPPMGEEDMVGLTVQPFPGDLFAPLLKFSDLLLLWIFGYRIFMTLQAGRQGRHSGEGLSLEETMARSAFHPLFRMLFMIEENGLPRFRSKAEADQDSEYQSSNGQTDQIEFHLLEVSNHRCLTL
jgi:hypothetical protein